MVKYTSALLIISTILISSSLAHSAAGEHHHHGHDHEHKPQESKGTGAPATEDFDYEGALFANNEHKDDINVQVVMWICERTQAHLFIKKFDSLIRPLPPMAQALCSTLFISIVPIFLIYLFNSVFMRTQEMRDQMTQYMISFAIGGLLGDVFFHTLPHMNAGSGHSHSHDHSHSHEHGSGSHSHSHGDHSHNPDEMRNNFIVIVGIIAFFLMEKVTNNLLGGHTHSHGGDEKSEDAAKKEKENRLKSYMVMSMVGDFIHNFTDGLSIGVAYVANYKMGVITTMAMLFHEIPHEIGDFALLFSLNYSICSILGLQLLTACGAMAGTVVGQYVGTLYMNQCLAFTSGGFLYFAINGLMSELKEVKGIFRLTVCLIYLHIGLYFMYVFALFE